MFKCNLLKNQLKAMVWGELSPNEDDRLRHHITKCAECQKELSSWQEFYALLQKAQTPPQDETFWEIYQKTFNQELDNLERVQKPGKAGILLWLDFGFKPVYAIAIIILAVGIGLSLRFYGPGKNTQIAKNALQENWADFYVKEFDEVAKDAVLIEPLPVNYSGK